MTTAVRALTTLRLVILIASLLALFAPALARAYCDTPEARVLWSYPSSGQADVPVDATLWLRLSRSGSLKVTLNGAPQTFVGVDSVAPELDAGRILQIEPGELEPNRDYVLRVAYTADSMTPLDAAVGLDAGNESDAGSASDGAVAPAPNETVAFEIEFRTGAARAPSPEVPQLAGAEVVLASFNDKVSQHACRAMIEAQGCFTASLIKTVSFDVSAAQPLAWLVLGPDSEDTQLWPASCGAPLLYMAGEFAELIGLIGISPKCYEVRAVQAGGVLSEATSYCTDTTVTGASDASAPMASEAGTVEAAASDIASDGGASPPKVRAKDDAGCSVPAERTGGEWFIALLTLLATRARRAGQRARAHFSATT